MIRKFTIYGERCSGTNYLENLILMNFDVKITWEYGHKHFFGFNKLTNSDDTLFICIVRNPYDWINSLYREQHHLPQQFKNIENFLNDQYYSLGGENNNYQIDLSIYSNQKYINIFEMRHIKLKFLMEDMPLLVKNYIFIKYEDLINDFINTMNKIKEKGLIVKPNIEFPLNTFIYKKSRNQIFKPDIKINYISKEQIDKKMIQFYEIKLNYVKI